MKYTEYTDEQIQEIKRQRDRRKRQQITVIVFILGVLFALVGILERGGAHLSGAGHCLLADGRDAAGGSYPQGAGGESQEAGCGGH